MSYRLKHCRSSGQRCGRRTQTREPASSIIDNLAGGDAFVVCRCLGRSFAETGFEPDAQEGFEQSD